MRGSFTLQSATLWNKTMLPAGTYTFRLAHTESDTKILKIHGQKQSLNVLIVGDAFCPTTCQKSWLNLDVQGGVTYVSSLNLVGYRANYDMNESAAAKEQQMAKNAAQSKSAQVAIHVDGNN